MKYARLSEDRLSVAEVLDIDPAQFERWKSERHIKADRFLPIVADAIPTHNTTTHYVVQGPYVIERDQVRQTWTVVAKSQDRRDEEWLRANQAQIRETIGLLESHTGTITERMNRVETVLALVAKAMIRSMLALMLVLPGFGAIDFTAENSRGVSSGALNISDTTLTLAVFSYRSAAPAGGAAALATKASSGNDRSLLFYNTGGRIIFGQQSGTDITYTDAGIYGNWVHVVGSIGGGVKSLSINGSLIGTNASVSMSTQADVGIGARFSTSWGAFFGGLLAHAAIWNVALTAEEIASLGNPTNAIAPIHIRPGNLVFYSPLDGINSGGGSGTAVNLVGPPVMFTNTVSQATTQPRIYR